MKEFVFIRHCESQGNAGYVTHSPQTIGLTGKGFEQAKLIPDCFDKPPDLIVTSPFLRTKQSAEPTTAKFPNAKCEEWNVHEFTYLSLVKYADTTVEFRRPFVEEYWKRCEIDYCDGDGTESFAEFISRANALIKKLSEIDQQTVAVFTHGQFMKAVLWLLLNDFPLIDDNSMKAFYQFLYSVFVPNACVLKIFEIDKNFLVSGLSKSHLPKTLISF